MNIEEKIDILESRTRVIEKCIKAIVSILGALCWGERDHKVPENLSELQCYIKKMR